VGARIRWLRKRARLTQAELAALIGRSQAWVSQVESGTMDVDSLVLIQQVARALRCHPADFLGPSYGVRTDAEQRASSAVARLRYAIQRFDLAPDWPHEPRSVDELAAAVGTLVVMRRAARYADLAEAVPDVIREIHAAAHAAAGTHAERLYALLAAAYKEADTAAHTLGFEDLATLAIERVRWAAARAADPGLEGVGDFLRVRDLWSLRLWGDALDVIDARIAVLDDVPGAAGTVAGGLHLRAAITAARALNVVEARARIAEAQQHLQRVGHLGDPYGLTFTEANVAIHAVSVEVEAGDGAAAMALAATTRLPEGTPRSRAARYRLDVARGCLLHGRSEHALGSLLQAERLAPLMVRNNAHGRQVAQQLLQGRAGADERLRLLAARMRLN
jgi:transcriptional regulator with XRE-family HTH domain